MAIKRNISVLNQGVVADIDIVYGSDLIPIEFYITDCVLPENAIATIYCTTSKKELVKSGGTIANNIISFEPTAGFFTVGKNNLQIRITSDEKNLYSFETKVNCKGNMASDDAEEVKKQPTLVTQLLTKMEKYQENSDKLSEEIAGEVTARENAIADLKAQGVQQAPLFANSIEECTDTSKFYVLPDGYIYACMLVEKPIYNNLANPTSEDWVNGYRYNANSVIAATTVSGAFISNYIPIKAGDIIRIKGVTQAEGASGTAPRFEVVPYDANGDIVTIPGMYLMPNNEVAASCVVSEIVEVSDDGVYSYEILRIWDNTHHSKESQVASVRVSGLYTDTESEVIITVNEEITDETVLVQQWTNTGRAFVPADYEDRIIGLEEKTTELDLEVLAQKDEALTVQKLFDGITHSPEWESGTFATNVGSVESNQPQATRQRMVSKITLPYNVSVTSDGVYKFKIALFNKDETISYFKDYNMATFNIPKNTPFRLIVCDANDNTLDISTVSSEEINKHIVISETRLNKLVNSLINWCAMGDSITEGYVSYHNGEKATSYVDKQEAWVYEVSRLNNWNLVNKGIGGTGYIKPSNGDTENVTQAYYIARNSDFTPYDLVTLAYGVNDWKGNKALGTIDDDAENPTTIYGGIKATIEAIIESNPYCKIVVITPLNCVGYDFNYGTEATNWGLSKSFSNNGTLEDVFQAIVNVCKYYGIEYIDMTHSSIVNRKNLLSCLIDGVHPSIETHKALAYELAKKISCI